MSILAGDVSIANADTGSVVEVVPGMTGYATVRVEYQASPATITSATASLYRLGVASPVSLTTTVTSPTARATIIAGNLTTLGAQLGEELEIQWAVTITQDAETHIVRHRQPVLVLSNLVRSAVMLDNIKARYAALSRTCAIPAGQTDFYPQIRLGLRDFWRDATIRFGAEHHLAFGDELAGLQELYALNAVLMAVGQTREWLVERERIDGQIRELWHTMTARIKRGTQAYSEPTTTTRIAILNRDANQFDRPAWRGGNW